MKRLIILCSILILPGCWDSIEIENRGFVIGAAIDKLKGDEPLLLTQQIVVPSGIGAGSNQGGGSKPGGSDAFLNEKETGESMFQIVREISAKTSRTPVFVHIKTIVISEDAAREYHMGKLLDYFIRDPEMRRGTLVLIGIDKASDILEVVPKNEKLPSLYIESLSENTFKNAEIFPKTRIGDVHEKFLQNRSFALTMVKKEGEAIELHNTAIISGKSFKMVGTLDREGTLGLNFLKNDVEGGTIIIGKESDPHIYEIYRSDTEVKVTANSPEDIHFQVKTNLEGALGEIFPVNKYSTQQQLDELERKFADEIKGFMETAIKKNQQYESDAIEFGKKLKQDNYPIWKKIKDEWENDYFLNITYDINVDVIIRNTGSIQKSKAK